MAILNNNKLARSFRNAMLALMILLLSYLFYVQPIFLIGYLIFDFEANPFHLAVLSMGIACIIFVYLTTHLSNIFVRSFVHYGMGLGFICFFVLDLALIVSTLQKKLKT